MNFRYSSDKDYYAHKFKVRARLLFSKTKGNEMTFNKVFQCLIEIAVRNGYGYLNQEIANIKYEVLRSHLPEDNLWQAYDLPTTKPIKEENKLMSRIIKKCGTFFKSSYRLFIHPGFMGWATIIVAIFLTFLSCYIVEHDKTVAFFNRYLPFIGLK